MFVENPLEQFSVEAQKESQRLSRLTSEEQTQELIQNFRGYENEVLKDCPVSIVYSYWFDEFGVAYTHPSKKAIHKFRDQFDPQERGISPLLGFEKTTDLMRQNPGQVILWYSPQGPATFDKKPNNPYNNIDFIYGQLYAQYYDDQTDQAKAVAIKVTNESIFQNLMPDVYKVANVNSLEERINTFLLNPVNTLLTIDQFINKAWGIELVYRDKSGKERNFDEILHQLKEKFINDSDEISEHSRFFAHRLARTPKREEDVLRTYLEFIRAHQLVTGEQITNLMGACGGRQVSATQINELLGIETINSFSNLYSTDFRKITQTQDYRNSGDKYEDYDCPHCNKTLSGEKKGDKASWRKACDHCGGKLGC